MAQYDVYTNPSSRSRHTVPYVVDVQSGLLDILPTRLVMPLSRVGVDLKAGTLPGRLLPILTIEGEQLAMQAHRAAAIDALLLKHVVVSVSDHAFEIRDALDAVISGI